MTSSLTHIFALLSAVMICKRHTVPPPQAAFAAGKACSPFCKEKRGSREKMQPESVAQYLIRSYLSSFGASKGQLVHTKCQKHLKAIRKQKGTGYFSRSYFLAELAFLKIIHKQVWVFTNVLVS